MSGICVTLNKGCVIRKNEEEGERVSVPLFTVQTVSPSRCQRRPHPALSGPRIFSVTHPPPHTAQGGLIQTLGALDFSFSFRGSQRSPANDLSPLSQMWVTPAKFMVCVLQLKRKMQKSGHGQIVGFLLGKFTFRLEKGFACTTSKPR